MCVTIEGFGAFFVDAISTGSQASGIFVGFVVPNGISNGTGNDYGVAGLKFIS